MVKTIESDTRELVQRVFPELSAADVGALERAGTPRHYPPGIEICRQGDPGSTLYIVGNGEIEILIHPNAEDELVVDTATGPTYFGEMALLGETARTATIRTNTACNMLEISHDAFLSITDDNPDLLRRLLRHIIGHLRRNDRAVINELNEKNGALQAAYAALAEQESLRTQFIATLSHELRTPLTSVQGYLGLLTQGALAGNSRNVAMDAITRNVATMAALTNQLFLLYELYPEEPAYTALSLPDTIVDALNLVRDDLGDVETAVQLTLDPQLPSVRGDKRTLTLALRAILDNAFKFNPARQPVYISAYRSGSEVAIAIRDRGVGIPEDEQQRIFEPFYRLEQEGSAYLFPGVGVGLTIAKLAVSRHNGRIEVESKLEVGSTFIIYLPLK